MEIYYFLNTQPPVFTQFPFSTSHLEHLKELKCQLLRYKKGSCTNKIINQQSKLSLIGSYYYVLKDHIAVSGAKTLPCLALLLPLRLTTGSPKDIIDCIEVYLQLTDCHTCKFTFTFK
uniref:Uncharacterized protein n=1 Tax=Pan paniscus TaxID=9597 RepID=A0A2R8Z901_PANPA